MSELVSVIIPCYNAENFVDNAIRSVYEQDYQNIELIIVNDGSTDKSEQVILKWKEPFVKEGRVFKYVYQENLGLGGAVNTGLKFVTGDYLTLLDADDKYLQGNIRKKAEFLFHNPDYSMVRVNGWICSGENKWLFVQRTEEIDENYFMLITFHRTNNWAGSYMVRTKPLFDCYKDRNIYQSRFGQNFQIILPVAYRTKCGFINEPLMKYLKRPNSLTINEEKEKQYIVEKQNLEGYRDIYHRVVNYVVKDNTECQKYLNIYDIESMREKLAYAIRFEDQDEIKRCIKWLKKKNEYNLDDRIRYYSSRRSCKAYFFRLIRKVRTFCAKNPD